MSDYFETEVVDNYLEHDFHNELDENCSSCFEEDCNHEWEDGLCVCCLEEAPDNWTDRYEYDLDGLPNE